MRRTAEDTGSVGTAISLRTQNSSYNIAKMSSILAPDQKGDSRCNLYEEEDDDKNNDDFTSILIRTPQNSAYDRSVREATRGMIRLQQNNAIQPLIEKNDDSGKVFITHSLSNNEKFLSETSPKNLIPASNKFKTGNTNVIVDLFKKRVFYFYLIY